MEKIADEITSVGKTKWRSKEVKKIKFTYHQKKIWQIIDDLKLFQLHVKIEHQKITNLLDTTSDNVPRFISKKWAEAHYQSVSIEDRYTQINK